MAIDEWLLLINAVTLIGAVIAEELYDATYIYKLKREEKREASQSADRCESRSLRSSKPHMDDSSSFFVA